MTQFKHFGARLAALGVSLALQGVALAGTDTPPTFRILSDQEVAAHTAMMNTLEGKAREEYRNAQYEQLKRRAMEHGFRMPATPPWAGMAMAATAEPQAAASAATPADEAAEAAARHAAMRDKLKAHQDSGSTAADMKPVQPVADTQPAAVDVGQAGVTIEAAPVVTTDAGGSVAAGNTTQQDATGSTPAMPAATVAEPAATTTPPVTSPAAGEPRFAPVEELNAAQAVSTVPAAPALPATPPAPPEAPAIPPTPAEAPTIPPTPYAAGPVASPAPPTPAKPVAEPSAPAPAATAAAPVTGESGPAYGGADSVTAYRESMRARFEDYMKERQAQHEETMRRQREQHEAQMEQKRAEAGRNRPYPFPAMPAYGPRYPAAFPGYRTPYWQQQPPPPPPAQ